jgi:outer membrane protein assembly factor BamB
MLNQKTISRVIALAFPFVVLLFSSPELLSQDWSQYRGSNGTGRSSDSLPSPDWQSGPNVIWKKDTALGFSSFAAYDDTVYTLVGEKAGKQLREFCVALDATTGEKRWSRALNNVKLHGGGGAGAKDNKGGDGPRSTPAYSDEHVYVYDASMNLHCLSAADGSVVWKHDILEEFNGRNIRWQNGTSPVISGDLVFIAGGGKNKSMMAFKKKDGSLYWSKGDETMTHATPIVAELNGTRQIIFFMQSGLISLAPETGKENWRVAYDWRTSSAASPIVDGDKVYCSAGYGVGAGLFQVSKSGEVTSKWRKKNRLMNHWSTPVLRDGYLYGMFGFKKYASGPLQCIELATGEIQWSERGFGQGNLILVGDKLIALSDSGELAIVKASPDSYVELARAKVLSGKCWSTPAYHDGKVFVRSTEEAACISLK